MTSVRAKMVCNAKYPTVEGGTVVYLHPVYSNDPASENKAFSDASPSGQVHLMIAKDKPAADAFVIGKSYFVDFTPVE